MRMRGHPEVESDRRHIDRAETEAGTILDAACKAAGGWRVHEPPTLEGAGDEAVIECVRIELAGVPCYPDGQAVAEAVADRLERLLREIDRLTMHCGRLRGEVAG